MFKPFLSALRECLAPAQALSPLSQQRISALFLWEVARADHDFSSAERSALQQILSTRFQLSDADLSDVLAQAEQDSDLTTSLHPLTQWFNREASLDDKYRLLVNLWQMALSDGQLDAYEDHLIRKIADLLYMSHSDFIRAKHEARQLMP
jgi:uncharacterized tellurite resistance protein B-like protein